MGERLAESREHGEEDDRWDGVDGDPVERQRRDPDEASDPVRLVHDEWPRPQGRAVSDAPDGTQGNV